MIKSLTIKNYAIIDSLTIDLKKGFNAFIGETGAGKSIIVGALSFLLKGRSDSSIIKNGKDKAIIEGVFEIKDENILNKLKEQDIDAHDDIIVKRVISQDNKNSIKINESNVTLSFLTELFCDYVDIHSQKDNHFLFNKKNQLSLLDKYCDTKSILLSKYQDAYKTYKKLSLEYDELLNNTYNEKEIEYYKFDLQELEEANLNLEEEKELEIKEDRYKKSEKYINLLNDAIALYDDNYGINENLSTLYKLLDTNDEQLQTISSKIKDLYYELDENMDKVKDILNSFQDSDLNIEQLEERLYLYSKLKRKHKTDTLGLIDLEKSLKDKINFYDDKDRVLKEKYKELNIALESAKELANKLSIERLNAAKALIKEVTKEAKDLLLNNIEFDISFNETDLNSNGKDDIEFLVSLNKGEDLKPLRNVASGGEISRLMLALKVVFAKLSNTGLLILDEIDSGVSGMVAQAVGQKISKIANDVEVISITHLAPVAACADNYYLIYKEESKNATLTNVKELKKDEFIEQLAIISNNSKDAKALAAAKELYKTSQKLIHEN